MIIENLLHQGRLEQCLKESVCDAYKFLKMQADSANIDGGDDKTWFEKIGRFQEQSIQAILASSGDVPHDIIYGIPASRILRRVNSLDALRRKLNDG